MFVPAVRIVEINRKRNGQCRSLASKIASTPGLSLTTDR